MAKKKWAKTYVGPTMVDKIAKDQGEWLERVIKNTQKVLNGRHDDPHMKWLVDQEERLQKQLADWRAANP